MTCILCIIMRFFKIYNVLNFAYQPFWNRKIHFHENKKLTNFMYIWHISQANGKLNQIDLWLLLKTTYPRVIRNLLKIRCIYIWQLNKYIGLHNYRNYETIYELPLYCAIHLYLIFKLCNYIFTLNKTLCTINNIIIITKQLCRLVTEYTYQNQRNTVKITFQQSYVRRNSKLFPLIKHHICEHFIAQR